MPSNSWRRVEKRKEKEDKIRENREARREVESCEGSSWEDLGRIEKGRVGKWRKEKGSIGKGRIGKRREQTNSLLIMAERTVRKVRQGKVDIDYEDSSLIVHYDLELVTIPLCPLLSMMWCVSSPVSQRSPYWRVSSWFPLERFLLKMMAEAEAEEKLLREFLKRKELRYFSRYCDVALTEIFDYLGL